MPKVIIIAGPNGAGKTTFAKTFLPKEAECVHFLNADLIASGLSPFLPELAAIKAGRLMLEGMDVLFRNRLDFAFETTLSGLGYIHRIKEWKNAGYHISLIFLSLSSVELAIERVTKRVRQGGHHIPEAVIRRRFTAGRDHFETQYRAAVDSWALYDNSSAKPYLLNWSENEIH